MPTGSAGLALILWITGLVLYTAGGVWLLATAGPQFSQSFCRALESAQNLCGLTLTAILQVPRVGTLLGALLGRVLD